LLSYQVGLSAFASPENRVDLVDGVRADRTEISAKGNQKN